MTNEEKRGRRREAALRGARTRADRQAQAQAVEPVAEHVAAEAIEPIIATGRQLVERARTMGREGDLYHQAHLARYGHRPPEWTVEQRQQLDRFMDGFTRPDGTVEPARPRRRKGR